MGGMGGMYGGIYEQRTVIMFALISGAGYEQRTSHNVRTLLGALDNALNAQEWGLRYHPECISQQVFL